MLCFPEYLCTSIFFTNMNYSGSNKKIKTWSDFGKQRTSLHHFLLIHILGIKKRTTKNVAPGTFICFQYRVNNYCVTMSPIRTNLSEISDLNKSVNTYLKITNNSIRIKYLTIVSHNDLVIVLWSDNSVIAVYL